MALTLLDVARNKKDSFESAVIETYADHCDILKRLPLNTIGTTEVHQKRRNSATTLGFRRRGESYGSVSGGGTDIVSDAVYAMGGNIDIDYTDMHDKAPVVDPLTERIREGVEAAGWTFNNAFVNGDHGVDADSFEGIRVRLAAGDQNQIVYGSSSSAELDVAAAITANTTATLQTFLDKIEDAIYKCDGHTADVALTSADFIRALKKAERRLNINKDTNPKEPSSMVNERRTSAPKYSGPLHTAFGVAWYDMGVKSDNTTQVIATETVNSQACRPVYFLKLGGGYLTGIQQYAMRVTKPTMLDDNVTYRVTIDWPVGLRHVHPRSFSKLAGCKIA